MSGPTCCCVSLDRRDRCDLLVGLEDFHLMSVARTPDIVVLDVESCNQLAGCPGCGVICSRPRARLGARVIRWAIRQLRFEGATIAGLARQLATTWNIVWSHIKPCLQAASDDPARFAGVRVLGVDEHVWHHQDRRRRGPRELTGIVDLTRGEDHPTARLLDLVPGRSGTVHENWLEERGEQFRSGILRSGIQIATVDPFQGQKERHRRSAPRRHQRPRCLPYRQARWRRSR